MPTPPQGHRESLAVVAESAAHALNNVLATLFAAESYLEDAADGPNGKAREAIASACASATALSAALHLLSISADDVPLLTAAGSETGLDVTVLHSLARWLADNAGIACDVPAHGSIDVPFDYDSLKALLLCAGFDLRRRAGARAEVRCTIRQSAPHRNDQAQLGFDFSAPGSGNAAPGQRQSRHPCSIALDHAAAVLPPAGVSLRGAEGGSMGWHITLRTQTSQPTRP